MNINKLIELKLEHKKLDGVYGYLSCFDYPKEYDKMEELNDQIYDLISEVDKYSIDSIINKILNPLVGDYNDEALEMDWHIYSYDEYIEIYEIFKTEREESLYYFNLENGKDWLQANELNHVEHLYYTRDYIAVAH